MKIHWRHQICHGRGVHTVLPTSIQAITTNVAEHLVRCWWESSNRRQWIQNVKTLKAWIPTLPTSNCGMHARLSGTPQNKSNPTRKIRRLPSVPILLRAVTKTFLYRQLLFPILRLPKGKEILLEWKDTSTLTPRSRLLIQHTHSHCLFSSGVQEAVWEPHPAPLAP